MILRRFILSVAACVTITDTAQGSPPIGQPAPLFDAKDSQGQDIRLSEYQGKVVILEWTNHDCPYVRKHYETGNMQAVQKEAHARGTVWLSIISSAPEKQGYVSGVEADRLTQNRGAEPDHVLLDPEGRVGRLYGARTTPHMYVIDEAGRLIFAGGIDDQPSHQHETVKIAKNYVLAALDDLGAGRDVADPSPRPYGCSVKYDTPLD